MQAEQLHYTSCRHGRSGHAGFQVRSASPGLAASEQQEIERRAGYTAPRDLPRQPAPQQIAEEFPVALRYAPLKDGRAVLLRAAYCGRDYSNRWGNFFTHALLFDAGELGGAWPVDLADWSGWHGCLAAEEDDAEASRELPFVRLEAPESGGQLGWKELQDFLSEDADRPRLLAQMGRAVLLGQADSRRLVVRDLRTACWYWVACITKLFPPHLARRLSFSTYEDDPRSAADVNATCGETDFTFDEAQLRFQFYGFDLLDGRCSEVPAAQQDYPAVAAGWMAREPERLVEFFAFLDLFDHGETAADLGSALMLFQASRGAVLPRGEVLLEVIRFAIAHATVRGRTVIVGHLARAVDSVLQELSGSEQRALLELFAETAHRSGEPVHREMAYRTWFGMVDSVVAGRSGAELAEDGEAILRRHLAAHVQELAERFLDSVAEVADRSRGLEASLFVLRTTGRLLDLVGRAPAWEQPEIQAQVRSLLAGGGEMAPRLLPVLEMAAGSAQGVETLGRVAVEAGCDDETVGRCLARVLAALPERAALDVRRRLEVRGHGAVLLGEWLEICDGSSDPAAAYRRYRRAVVDVLPIYREQYGCRITSSVLGTLSEKERLPLVRDWLSQGEVDGFPRDLAERCLAVANPAVDLLAEDDEADRWSRRVAETAALHGVVLHPDRPALRQELRLLVGGATRGLPRGVAGESIDTGDTGDRFDAARLRDHLAVLSADEYREVVAAILPRALRRVTEAGLHRRLLFAFQRDGEGRALSRAYRSFFDDSPKGAWPRSLAAALEVYLAWDGRRTEERTLADLQEPLRKALIRSLRHLDDEQLEAMCEELASGKTSRRWGELADAVRKRRRGLTGWLKEKLSRSRKKGDTRV